MVNILLSILIITILSIIYLKSNPSKEDYNNSSLLNRFRNQFKDNKKLRRRLYERNIDLLLNNPKSNIQTNHWDQDEDLLEKANIHKARLNRYGESMMNGTIYHQCPKGGVFTISNDGEKKYV